MNTNLVTWGLIAVLVYYYLPQIKAFLNKNKGNDDGGVTPPPPGDDSDTTPGPDDSTPAPVFTFKQLDMVVDDIDDETYSKMLALCLPANHRDRFERIQSRARKA